MKTTIANACDEDGPRAHAIPAPMTALLDPPEETPKEVLVLVGADVLLPLRAHDGPAQDALMVIVASVGERCSKLYCTVIPASRNGTPCMHSLPAATNAELLVGSAGTWM
jgi:hypothetical protein